MNRREIVKEIKATGLPLRLRDIRRVYIFGSSLYKTNPNDIDVAIFLSPLHKIFDKEFVIYMQQIGRVEYHLAPDTVWHRRQLKRSSEVKRVLKIELRTLTRRNKE